MALSTLPRVALAALFALLPAELSAQYMVCGPNGCRMVERAPIAAAVRPRVTVQRVSPSVTRYAAPASVRVTTYRRGLFGRRVPVTRYVPATQATSYGSSGSTAVYSSGSHGGYQAAPVTGASYGSSGGYRMAPAKKATPPAEKPPADAGASVGSACPCGPDCRCVDCQCVQIASLPTAPTVCALPGMPVIASLPSAGLAPPTVLAMR